MAAVLREGEGEEVEGMGAEVDEAAAMDMDPRGPVGMLLALLGPAVLRGPAEEGETEAPTAPAPLVLLVLTELWREMPDQLFPPRPPRGAKPAPLGGGT